MSKRSECIGQEINDSTNPFPVSELQEELLLLSRERVVSGVC